MCPCRFKYRLLESSLTDNAGSMVVDPRFASTVNLVVAGLVNMVGLRTHYRLLYHGVLCLANLAQDAIRTTPMYATPCHVCCVPLGVV